MVLHRSISNNNIVYLHSSHEMLHPVFRTLIYLLPLKIDFLNVKHRLSLRSLDIVHIWASNIRPFQKESNSKFEFLLHTDWPIDRLTDHLNYKVHPVEIETWNLTQGRFYSLNKGKKLKNSIFLKLVAL